MICFNSLIHLATHFLWVRDYSGPWGYSMKKGGKVPDLLELTFQRERHTVNLFTNETEIQGCDKHCVEHEQGDVINGVGPGRHL